MPNGHCISTEQPQVIRDGPGSPAGVRGRTGHLRRHLLRRQEVPAGGGGVASQWRIKELNWCPIIQH